MGFGVYLSPRRGPHRTSRQITAPPGRRSGRSYTAPVSEAMDR
ncbi:DUF5925 domain-containing protein [Streptomyces decoyicus]|uniref:DUF5925 domain-containing protein n=1 Tax=Streptomyces decoyicus TaxID=249567 RepID=A0ABZ1FUS3_9ACTN|nr:DUF5925 domain-containing protein [Streptomyces decoyicus]